MIELALIPPLAHLTHSDSRVHLVLVQHTANRRYYEHYRKRAVEGHRLILDNGTYENGRSQADIVTLLAIARGIGAREVVLPDVLKDRDGNWAAFMRSLAFLYTHAGFATWNAAGSPRLMVVPQVDPHVQTIIDYKHELTLMVYEMEQLRKRLIGLEYTIAATRDPDYVWPNGLTDMLEAISRVRFYGDFSVHMLGWPNGSNQMRDIAQRYPFIRSVDTAQPYVSAWHNEFVDTGKLAPRPHTYFGITLTGEQLKLARSNAHLMRQQLDE